MRKYRAIVQTLEEPKDHEVIWHYKRRLFYYNNGWEPFLVYTDPWIMEQITSLNSITSGHNKSINSLQYEVATMKGWTQQVPGLITRVGGLETGQGRVFADINTLISRMDETQGKANGNEANITNLIQRVDTIQGLTNQIEPLTTRVDKIQGITNQVPGLVQRVDTIQALANSNKARLDNVYKIEEFESLGFGLNDNDKFFIRGAGGTVEDNKHITWGWFKEHGLIPLIQSTVGEGGGGDVDLTGLTNRVDSLEGTVGILSKDHYALSDNFDGLKTNVDGLKSTVSSIDERVTEAETQIESLDNKYATTKSAIASLVNRVDSLYSLGDASSPTVLGDDYLFSIRDPHGDSGNPSLNKITWATLRDNYIKPLVGTGSGGGDYSAVITDLQNTVAGHESQIHTLKTKVDEVTLDFDSLTSAGKLGASEIADTMCLFGQRTGSSGDGFVQVPVGALKEVLNIGDNSEEIANLQSTVSRLDNAVGDIKDDVADLGLKCETLETESVNIHNGPKLNLSELSGDVYFFSRVGGTDPEYAQTSLRVLKEYLGDSIGVPADVTAAVTKVNSELWPFIQNAIDNGAGRNLENVITNVFTSSSTIEAVKPENPVDIYTTGKEIKFDLSAGVKTKLQNVDIMMLALSNMLANQKEPEDLVCDSLVSSDDIVVTKPDVAGGIYENPMTLSLTAFGKRYVLRDLYSKFVSSYYITNAPSYLKYDETNVTTDQALSMVKYMSQLGITADYDYKLYNADIPAIILTIPGDKGVSFVEGAMGSKLKYITFKSTTKPDSIATEVSFGKMDKAFSNCTELVTIDGIIKPTTTSEASTTSALERAFENCTSLVNLKIKGVTPQNNLNLSTCPVLSQESLQYIIENKSGTDSMDLHLHPDVLAAVPANMKTYYKNNYQVTVL